MIDTHLHLLPSLDDGPASPAEAQDLAACLLADGVQAAIVTPHLNHPAWPDIDVATIRSRFSEYLKEAPPELRLYLGAEVHVDSFFMDLLEQDAQPNLLTLAGSRYLLLEFPLLSVGPDPASVIHECRVRGYVPVLAHPERIPAFIETPGLVEKLIEAGAHLQLGADILAGEEGASVRALAGRWIDAGLVALVASDAHHPIRRPPNLVQAYASCQRRWGEACAHRLFVDNPTRIVENRDLAALGVA